MAFLERVPPDCMGVPPDCMVPSDFCLPLAELAAASLQELKELSGYLIDTIMKGANNAVHEGS
jgi:hypothetical protein